MTDPVKKILETSRFKIFVWQDEGISVSWNNKTVRFDDVTELEEIHFLTGQLLKAIDKGEI